MSAAREITSFRKRERDFVFGDKAREKPSFARLPDIEEVVDTLPRALEEKCVNAEV